MSIVDLLAGAGHGPIWGDATEELNVTLMSWLPGDGPPAHVNDERDVLMVVIEGTAQVVLDGVAHPIRSGHLVVIPLGTRRALTAGAEGVRYLSIHRRRGGLQIRRIETEAVVSGGAPGARPHLQ